MDGEEVSLGDGLIERENLDRNRDTEVRLYRLFLEGASA
jgi:hypothetical protein